jgi:hypothetical protein
MNRHERINHCLIYWERSQRESKFFAEDRKNYLIFLESKSDPELEDTYNRLSCLNSKSFENAVNKEINKLDKAGMYNF